MNFFQAKNWRKYSVKTTTARHSLSTVEYFLSASVSDLLVYWTIDSTPSEFIFNNIAPILCPEASVSKQKSCDKSGSLSIGAFNNCLFISFSACIESNGYWNLPDFFKRLVKGCAIFA
jgi:hypothetical protein